MDDTVLPSDDQNQPIQVSSDQAASGQTTHPAPIPHQPVSGPHKEHAPIVQQQEAYMQPSEPEIVIAPELKEHGIEVSPDTEQPDIPAAVRQLGVVPAKQYVPVPTAPSESVTLPMDQVQALATKKTASWRNSIRWLAELVLEQGRKGQLKD